MRRLCLALFLAIIIFFPAAAVRAAGKVVIMSLNRTALSRLVSSPSMAPWLTRGSLGLVNTSTGGRLTTENIYATLGAGSRALGTEHTRLAFTAGEEYNGIVARDIFSRHQGIQAKGQVLHLGAADLEKVNNTLQHPVRPGLLGETLRAGQKVTAVIGNADGQGYGREAVAFLADSDGQVALGDVSRNILRRDAFFPFGWRMDREKVWERFDELYPRADVILVDWGDTARLDEYRSLLRNQVAVDLEESVFADVAWFLAQLSGRLQPDDILALISPLPPAGVSGGNLLTYLAVLGGPFPAHGFLTSSTTRRPGLVSATDVAPLVLERTGLPVPGGMLGMTVTPVDGGGISRLLRMQAEIDRVYRLRPPMMRTYVFFQIVFVLGALLNMFVRVVPFKRFEAPLLGLLTVPVLLLYLPLHTIPPVWGFTLTVVAVIMAVFLLQRATGHIVKKLAVIGLVTSVSITADLLRNAPLMKMSVLGYDPVSGARYYGLGNEYMGVLVGSTVLGASAALFLAARYRRWLLPVTAFYFLVVLLVVAAPGGGANFGGTVTAFTAFIVALPVLAQIRPGWRNGLAALALLGLTAGVVYYINVRVPENVQSHLGRTVGLFERDGWQALRDVAARKAAMNVRLFRYSQWSRAFLAFLAVFAVLVYRPRWVLRDVHRLYPELTAGFLGIIAGSIAAFLVNDSGVVAAATTLLYAGVPVIILSAAVIIQNGANT